MQNDISHYRYKLEELLPICFQIRSDIPLQKGFYKFRFLFHKLNDMPVIFCIISLIAFLTEITDNSVVYFFVRMIHPLMDPKCF